MSEMTAEEKRNMTSKQRRIYNAGFEARARMSNKSGCCCLIGEDDETVLKTCNAHKAAITEAVEAERKACAEVARNHGEFCQREADNGGDRVLYERSKGCFYIAQTIEARQKT